MNLHLQFTIDDADSGSRLDRVVVDWVETNAEVPPLSRSYLQRLIRSKDVQLNGQVVAKSKIVRGGDEVTIALREPETLELEPQDLELDIIFEDSDLVVVNKRAGMVVHPGPGHSNGTLVNALLHHCPDLGAIGGTVRPGIVHRLDKGTTGLIVVAKNALTMESLSQIFAKREIQKTYRSLVLGQPNLSGSFSTLYGRHPTDRIKFTSQCTQGKVAETYYRRVAHGSGCSDVEIDLGTGRTHQIRVHFSEHGYPLLGDPLYRNHWQPMKISEDLREEARALTRPALHAWRLKFRHPRTGEELRIEAPIPQDMQFFIDRLHSNE